jgi:hypothetical protein
VLIGPGAWAAAEQGRVRRGLGERASGGLERRAVGRGVLYLGLAVFTAYFLSYAGTELDLRRGPELVQARLVTEDVAGLAAFYAGLVGQGAVERVLRRGPAGPASVGFSRRKFTRYCPDRVRRARRHRAR